MNKNSTEAATRFKQDTKDHAMTVIKSDGVYRHLKFRREKDRNAWFEILTWPGCLVIHGDFGSYLFSRLNDMFSFFRDDEDRINPRYWAEKVEAQDKHGGIKEWDADGFVSACVERFRDREWSFRNNDGERRSQIFRRFRDEVLSYSDNEQEAMFALRDFSGFRIDDYYELASYEYTFHYLWCCHAIVWAIAQFDAAQVPNDQPAIAA